MNQLSDLNSKEKRLIKLLSNANPKNISLSALTLTNKINTIVAQQNLSILLKCNSYGEVVSPFTAELDSYQNPIYCIEEKNSYVLVSGYFSYFSMRSCPSLLSSDVRVHVLDSKISIENRLLLFRNEYSRHLIKHFPDLTIKNTAPLLCHLFDTDNIIKLMAKPEFRQIFANIKNKTDFCKWMKVSRKSFCISVGNQKSDKNDVN